MSWRGQQTWLKKRDFFPSFLWLTSSLCLPFFQIHEIMDECWDIDPISRPSFKELTLSIDLFRDSKELWKKKKNGITCSAPPLFSWGWQSKAKTEVKRSQLCRITTMPQKADISESDVLNCQGAFEQGTKPPGTKVDLVHVKSGWAMKRMRLYEELAGLALAVERHLKKTSISCFVFLCMCIYLKCICVNMSRKIL